MLVLAVALAAFASLRVINERETLARALAQIAFVWLIPLIGPLATLHFLRKEPERGSGRYSSDGSLLEAEGSFNQRDATFGKVGGNVGDHGETSDSGHG